ncbi:hypothetical protein H8D30_02085 [bacterium]|nr:hypothetical protein [bacterium]
MKEREALASLSSAFPLIGDDAYWTAGGIAVSTDLSLPGRHFLPQRPHGWAEGAWHSVARVVSDLGAVGAKPWGVLTAYALPSGFGEQKFQEVVDSLLAAEKRFGIKVLGGDLGRATGEGMLSVTGWGIEAIGPGRKGMEEGDIVAVTGIPGKRPLGWAMALQEIDHPWVEDALMPHPPFRVGRELAPLATAMMDITDGLGLDLSRFLGGAGWGIKEENPPPWNDELSSWASKCHTTPEGLWAEGGDYELLLTIGEKDWDAACQLAREGKTELSSLGTVARQGAPSWWGKGSEIDWKR